MTKMNKTQVNTKSKCNIGNTNDLFANPLPWKTLK